jgi:hypothetical protein
MARKRYKAEEIVAKLQTQSLRLAQRKLIGFVKALDFSAAETLVSDLQPRAQGFRRSQSFDCVADGFGRCGEAQVVLAATFGALSQEQFSWCVVVERHSVPLNGVR